MHMHNYNTTQTVKKKWNYAVCNEINATGDYYAQGAWAWPRLAADAI